jgi:hypothetical protein
MLNLNRYFTHSSPGNPKRLRSMNPASSGQKYSYQIPTQFASDHQDELGIHRPWYPSGMQRLYEPNARFTAPPGLSNPLGIGGRCDNEMKVGR